MNLQDPGVKKDLGKMAAELPGSIDLERELEEIVIERRKNKTRLNRTSKGILGELETLLAERKKANAETKSLLQEARQVGLLPRLTQ